ncbi:MAG: hypothetical protein AB7O43_03090 [Hyphomicrobiaceae bacterium]
MQTCTAGLQLGPIVTASQQCQNWCWAACIEAVFAMRGYRVSQRAIVRKIYGGTEPCSRAIGPQIIQAVNGPWIDANNRRFMAYAAPLIDLQFGVLHPQAAALAAQELARNNPLINGAAGHATVMTAMTYVRNNLGQGMPVQIIVRDPWPGNPNRRVLTPREVAGTFFLARVTTS